MTQHPLWLRRLFSIIAKLEFVRMHSPMSRLATLSRPRLLVRAARFGITEFHRERSLRRIFRDEQVPPPGQAFEQLFVREAEMDEMRQVGEAGYSPARHVELLAALIHEAQIADCRLAA